MFEKLTKHKQRVIVIGDLILDHYLDGNCIRISPEAPVQIIDIKTEKYILGGAGNVVNNLKSLGADVQLISVIGNCETSKKLKQLLTDNKINQNYVFEETSRTSPLKTRIISSHQQVIRFDKEDSHEIYDDTEKLILDALRKILLNNDVILLSDYGKGLLTGSLTRKIISAGNKKNVKTIVDPKGSDYSKYCNAYLLTPNLSEASKIVGTKIETNTQIEKALKKLKLEYQLDLSLITLSEKGIATYDNSMQIFPTFVKDVFDVTGAGDTVISALAFALNSEISLSEKITFANLAAGIVVSKTGSSTTNLDEIKDHFNLFINSHSYSKIFKKDSLSKEINKLRRKNKTIVFTNGCFDILHYGHIDYLEKAKNLGDILIVAVNSDQSVRRLKGKNRPVNNEYERSRMLAALAFVDYVVIFSEDSPIKFIEDIVPDILVKGSDYKDKEVVGSNIAKETVLIDYIPNKSTSNLIKKIISL